MTVQTDFTVKAEPEDFKNMLFLAMELSRATWLVATFAPRLGDKIKLVRGSEPSGDACIEKMRRLVKLHGIGAEFATVLTREVFYRPFQNRRQGFWYEPRALDRI
jgi:hypothetical protein